MFCLNIFTSTHAPTRTQSHRDMLSLTVTLMVFKIPCSVSCNMFLFSFQVSGDTFCGLLAASDGIFRDCIKNAPALAASYGENCRFDVCANMDLPTPAKRAACGTLEAFSAQCFDLGYGHVDWRTVADCRKCKLSPFTFTKPLSIQCSMIC